MPCNVQQASPGPGRDAIAPESGSVREAESASSESAPKRAPREIGGREGPEPTRYGDWEKNGRCIDF